MLSFDSLSGSSSELPMVAIFLNLSKMVGPSLLSFELSSSSLRLSSSVLFGVIGLLWFLSLWFISLWFLSLRRSVSLRIPRLLILSIVVSLIFFSTIASNISSPFRKSFSQVIYKFIIIFLDSSTTLCNFTSVRLGFIIISLLSGLDSSVIFTNTNNLSITESNWS